MNLVVGSTGMLGGMVARRLIESGKPVRVMVRRPSTLTGAEIVTGDLKDPASLDAACQGATTVITTANSAQRGGADTVASVDLIDYYDDAPADSACCSRAAFIWNRSARPASSRSIRPAP